MKLNNKGWGTLEMFLLSGGLLIALFVSVYFISKLYGSFESSIGNRQYFELQAKLETAAKNYVETEKININGETKISLTTLINRGYISNFIDSDGNICAGYVIVSNVDSINQYNGFISCPYYQSLNY